MLPAPVDRERSRPANYWGEGATTLEWKVSSPPPFHTYEEGATTLEWQVSSPPPHHSYEELPMVR